jgi:membrane dipeptidase
MNTSYIDFHCDTLMASWKRRSHDIFDTPDTMIDVKRLHTANCMAQFFAVFMPPEGYHDFTGDRHYRFEQDDEYIDWCRETLAAALRDHADEIVPAGNAADIEANAAQGKISALLTFEDGRPVAGADGQGSIEKLEYWYAQGFRLISLTWNGENVFGYPNAADAAKMALGLKPFGKAAVERMFQLGMITDVSHLSDGGFWDVVALAKAAGKPFVASHSNARALSAHQRNLGDEQIRALADCGGVAGLNFNPPFLDDPAKGDAGKSTAVLLSAHARHFIKTGGEDCVAIGSDLDGIGGDVELDSADKMGRLFDQLARDGLTDAQIEKLAWRNGLRVIGEVCGGAGR